LWFKAVGNACGVYRNVNLELQDTELPQERQSKFDEDGELQQLIDGQICAKIYDFSTGTFTIFYQFSF
jgi:hypothetical protein